MGETNKRKQRIIDAAIEVLKENSIKETTSLFDKAFEIQKDDYKRSSLSGAPDCICPRAVKDVLTVPSAFILPVRREGINLYNFCASCILILDRKS